MGEVDNTRFSGAVNRGAKASLHPGDRSGRNDRAASRLAHLGNRILDAEEYAAQENRMGAVPTFGGDRLQRTNRPDQAGVIEGDVETAEFADRAPDQRFDVCLSYDVSPLEDSAAFAGKTDCSRTAHTARRASYHSNLVIEPSHFDDPLASPREISI